MKSKENKITVAIPSYNNESTIQETIKSVLAQEYPLKEILVLDDDSRDMTPEFVKKNFPMVRVVVNPNNLGIGKNLQKCMELCKTKYIIYLCADDLMVNPKTLTDVVNIFDAERSIGVIGRYYYFFMDGHSGPIGVCREPNILLQSCCPSGIAFRRQDNIEGTNRIFIEMPYMVSQYLKKFHWTLLPYDTIAARFSPGNNTGNKEWYYTESPTANWIDLLGQNYQYFPIFIQLKNRAPKLLWKEIWLHIQNDKFVMLKGGFWLHAIAAILVPSWILRQFSKFYRHRIARRFAKVIERPKDEC